MPLLTAIIPTYQRSRLLLRALRSLQHESCDDFEVHVWDNASDDDTSEVVKSLVRSDPRIKYRRNAANVGWLENFRRGMAAVETPFFHMMGDDDVVFPWLFEDAIAALMREPRARMFVGATAIANPDGTVIDVPVRRWRTGFLEAPDGAFEILRNGHSDLPGIVFRREVLSEIGEFNPEVGIGVDVDYQLRVAIRAPIVVSKRLSAVFSHREGGQQSSNEYAPVNFWPGLYVTANTLKAMEDVPEEVRKRACEMLMGRLRRMLLLRGCKTAVVGLDAETDRIARTLEEVFGLKVRPVLLRLLAKIAVGAPSRLTTRLVDSIRSARMNRILAPDERQTYSAQVSALIGSLA